MSAKFVVTIFSHGFTTAAGWFDDAKFARNFAKDCVKRCGPDDAITVYERETPSRVYHVESGIVVVDNTERYI